MDTAKKQLRYSDFRTTVIQLYPGVRLDLDGANFAAAPGGKSKGSQKENLI